MNLNRLIVVLLSALALPVCAYAADTPSASVSMMKMVLGLVLVLMIMALLAWGAKRLLPSVGQHNNVVKVLGGASVGTRERVVVLEIAGRWIVVGVANGQVNAIADLAPGAEIPAESKVTAQQAAIDLPPFAKWLKQSMNKFSEK
ncbi:MAG: flagellar biosynthetic protein FliO [Methylophilus sp.]|jgi:flagellar protein FliO/FliZ